ncbi:hypothetical protein [Candidatus Leptofilum sp.]|uniref:hypothetical protein n=1 Tax=Candidatus Leptofilum sp. TaxID=3241576 RepID=UPI003B5B9AD5
MKIRSSLFWSLFRGRFIYLVLGLALLVAPFQVRALSSSDNHGLFMTEEVVCASFDEIAAGESVEGFGVVHPSLSISTSSNNAVAIEEEILPGAYRSPNTDYGLRNNGVGITKGFFDLDRVHDYTFTIEPGLAVSHFSVRMLDYGDFDQLNVTEHAVILEASNALGVNVASDTLFFTSDGQTLPRDGSSGDLSITGDATSASEGDPGNYVFSVSGNQITQLQFHYYNNSETNTNTPTDPFFALTDVCFQLEELVNVPNSTCADFNGIAPGSSVEGLGTIHPDLNIASSTGNAVAVVEEVLPGAYRSPNTDNGIRNNGAGALGGFFDSDREHHYQFSFASDVSVSYFSIKMLDYGDFNALNVVEHGISLVAYDANGIVVDVDSLFYTSDELTQPRSGSYGDLFYTGDATSAPPGFPGNYSFEVSGSGIEYIEVQYYNDSEDTPNDVTDPYFAIAVLCFSPEEAPDTTTTVCANFGQLPPGSSVEGLGTIHPELNITTSIGNAVAVVEEVLPGAYRAPNTDLGIRNNGAGALGGFYDADRIHDYSFSFAPDTSVSFFSLKLLDFGDWNGAGATEHEVSLLAYNSSGDLVGSDSLFLTSDGAIMPRSGSFGDLFFTGDAASAMDGQPGRYTFAIEGSGITRLELEYGSNVASWIGPTDIYFGLALLCFEPEQAEPELDPPTAVLELLRPKQAPEIGGKYLVEYACSETAPNLVSATINGYDVVSGQEVSLVVRDTESARIVNELLVWLFAPEFSFEVTCADDSGNEISTIVVPEFDTP